MSEADKIIKSLRDSGKKVEEFYMSNKTSDKNVAKIEDNVMSQQAFYELIDSFEVVSKLTMYGRKSIKHYVKKMQAELEQKDKRIQELEEENSKTQIMSPYYVKENYIPKQKIKDKIEELKQDKESKYYDSFLEERDIEKTIEFLQELLQEEAKNEL